MLGKRLMFWGAVAGVSILANFGLEAAAHKLGSPGLLRFAALTHLGTGGSQSA